MSRFCLCLSRFLLSAWVGAAILFVIIGVSTVGQVTSPEFDRLLVIRFPNYYRVGFVCVAVSLAALFCSLFHPTLPRRRHLTALLLVALALGLMLYDYRQIYLPLEAIVTPPGQPRPMEFVALHQHSKTINAIHVGLCLFASFLLCWPAPVAGIEVRAAE